ncbi:hypothetical protein CER19_21950 [Pseudomonas sp. GL93]|nr:hypothetical protein CER19_21950 [Pseudomonas sp. GL93]
MRTAKSCWWTWPDHVGASLLAKNSPAPRSLRKHALSLTFFASKLAPTYSVSYWLIAPSTNTCASSTSCLRWSSPIKLSA